MRNSDLKSDIKVETSQKSAQGKFSYPWNSNMLNLTIAMQEKEEVIELGFWL